MKLKKADKILLPVRLILLTALVAGIMIAGYLILPMKESNMYKRTSAGDYFYYLQSDSMEPEVKKGSRITVRRLEEEDFAEGTVREGLIVLYEYEGVFYLHKTGRAESGYLPLYDGGGQTINTLPAGLAENYIVGKLTVHSRFAGAIVYIFGVSRIASWGLIAFLALSIVYELFIILRFRKNAVYNDPDASDAEEKIKQAP